MKALFKMNFDYGRSGSLEGLFVAEKKYIDYLVEQELEVHFGEVLGKHSDVCGRVAPEEITLVTRDVNVLEVIEEYELGNGYNPLDYPLYSYPKDGEVDICFDDWTAEDYIKWELTQVKPDWYKEED